MVRSIFLEKGFLCVEKGKVLRFVSVRNEPMKLDLEKCLHCVSTQFVVSEIERSVSFYTESLGFGLNFKQETYAGLGIGPHSIHLKLVDTVSSRERDADQVDLVIGVTDLDFCYEAVQSEDVPVIQPLRETPYGREFYIEDPDGNRIAFFDVTS